MKRAVIAALLSVLISGCGPKALSPEQIQQVADLKLELVSTDAEIENAAKQQDMLSGGLIKSLVMARLEILKTNKALIQQRINAIESGAKVEVVTNQTSPDLKLAEKLTAELATLTREISTAKQEAAQYDGGLVGSIKKATIATQEQSLAMLQQKLLSAKYGLAVPTIAHHATSTASKSNQQEDPVAKDALLPPGIGPFGLQMGLTKQNVEDMTGVTLTAIPNSLNIYTTEVVPKTYNAFETYILLISPKVGLCRIRALSGDINTDSYGLALKSKVKDIAESLTANYGKGKATDVLLPGSLWKEPGDWMIGLLKKERYFGFDWEEKKDKPFKNDLQGIMLEATAVNSGIGSVYLQYDFKNVDECIKEANDKENSAL
jgi:hypothetical protein